MSFDKIGVFKRKKCLSLLFGGLLFGLVLMYPTKTYAAYGNMPNVLPEDIAGVGQQYINLTDGDQDEPTGYGAYLPESFLKVYTDSKANKNIRIDVYDRNAGVARACRNYFVEWHMKAIDANEDIDDSVDLRADFFRVTRCTGEAGYPGGWTFTIPDYAFATSTKPGHQGLYVAALNLKIVSERDAFGNLTDGNHTATLKVNTDGNSKLGFMGSRAVTIYPSLLRSRHTITAKFRTPCNLVAGWHTVTWQDDDKGTGTTQDDNIWTTVNKYDVNGNPQPAPPVGGASWDGGSTSSSGTQSVYFEPGFRYEFQFNNVQGGNGISIIYPWDSGDWDLPCPGWNVDIDSSVSSPWTEIGTNATFTHIIKDAGGTTANPNFTTRRANMNYPPSASANIPGIVDLLSSTANPKQWTVNDSGRGTKLIPITGLGVDFCQSYTVDPKESNNGSAGYGEYSTTFNGNTCTRGVGGFSKPVSKAVSTNLIEGGESLSFAANVSTRLFTTFGTWVGYKVNCSYKLIRVTPAGAESDIAGTSGNCTRDIRGDNEGTDVIARYDVPDTEPIGNKICLSVSIDSAIGQNGNDNSSLIDTLSPNPAKDGCNRVTAKPFLRSYLGDVISGGMFGATGTQGAGTIKGYLKDNEAIYPNPHAGSGVEFAAIAAGVIDSFASANMRDLTIATLPKPTNGLSFYNAGNAGGAIGKSIPTDRKVKDFFKETKSVDTFTSQAGGNYNISSKEGQEWVKNTSTNLLRISGSANKRFALYVEGDVLIDNDIKYPPANYNNKDAIPYFSLVVKGNIYIKSPAVTEMDGLYIAQPQDESGGENNKPDTGVIYTCAEGENPPYVYSAASLYSNCEHRLTVNGGFIAQNVKFLRTNGTQRDIQFDEGDPGSDPSPGIDNNDLGWAYSEPEKARLISEGKSNCIKMEEALGTPASGGYGTWQDNYLCSSRNYGLRFYDGGVNGTRDPGNTAEQCSRSFSVPLTPNYNPLLTISGNHPIAVAISNITWENDNYLCASTASNAQIELYTGTGAPTGKQCIQIIEDSDIQWTSDKNRKVCYHVKDTGGAGYRAPSWEQVNRNNPHIAEQFILTPEVLIGDPAFKPKPKGDPDNGRYDSIITLPPVL